MIMTIDQIKTFSQFADSHICFRIDEDFGQRGRHYQVIGVISMMVMMITMIMIIEDLCDFCNVLQCFAIFCYIVRCAKCIHHCEQPAPPCPLQYAPVNFAMQCFAIFRNSMFCNAMFCNVLRCNILLYSTVCKMHPRLSIAANSTLCIVPPLILAKL